MWAVSGEQTLVSHSLLSVKGDVLHLPGFVPFGFMFFENFSVLFILKSSKKGVIVMS